MADEEKPVLENDRTRKQIMTFKNSIIPKLSELGVRRLTVNYSGSGDEGLIDGIEIEPEGLAIPDELEEQISDLADEFLFRTRQLGRRGRRYRHDCHRSG